MTSIDCLWPIPGHGSVSLMSSLVGKFKSINSNREITRYVVKGSSEKIIGKNG